MKYLKPFAKDARKIKMNLRNEVCSLESATRLKELNIKQESLYAYVLSEAGMIDGEAYENKIMLTHGEVSNSPNKWAAFTAGELGRILPNGVCVAGQEPFDSFRIAISKFISVKNEERIFNFTINYECDSVRLTGEEAWLRRRLTSNIYDPNLADAMAKMLIYLIENNLYER
jgi:hypothetical protein